MECYSAIEKEQKTPFAATWMGLETHTERSKSEKEKYHMILFIYGI